MTLNEASLEKRFNMVSTSQGSIQSLSFFCLHYKNHHKKIAQIWLRSLQKAKSIPHRLTLIYLANDIVQNAKRKNALSFIDDFKSILKETVPYLRDEKIKTSVERVFSIWQDRSIFDGKFTAELKEALNSTGSTASTGSTGNKTAKLLEESMRNQKKKLKECEEQLAAYNSQLDCITKLRDELLSSH